MSKNDDMEKTIQTIKGDNEELMKENESLKRKIGGYKTANENYRKQVAELKERVEHYKALDIEGDELYEQKIAECDQLKKELEKARNVECASTREKELEKNLEQKQDFIEHLQARVQELAVIKSGHESEIASLNATIEEMDKEIENLCKPWWKKIFG